MTRMKSTAAPLMAPLQKPLWPKKKIGELFEVQLGKMLSQKAKQGQLFPYLANFNVRWGSFDLSRLNKMAFSESEQEKFSLKPGDLLMCEGGEIGRCAIWRETGRKLFYQKALHRLRPLDGTISTDFVYYYMAQIASKGELPKLVGETSIAHLTREKLLGLHIPVPSIEEQTKIVNILSTWDKAIEIVEALIENCKVQKKALMQQLLTGKKRFPGFSKKWINTTISQIAEINPKKSKPPQNGLVSFVSMDSVSEEARLLKTEIRQYSEVSAGFTAFRNHDVLAAKITPCFENGKGAYLENLKNGVGFGSTEFHVIRAKNNNLPKFVYWLTNTYEFRKRGETNMQGSVGQKRVPTDYFRAVKFMIPKDLEEQKRIAEAISVADTEIEKYQLQLKKFKAEKVALKQKLLTGRRRVK